MNGGRQIRTFIAVLFLCGAHWHPASASEAVGGRFIIENEDGLADAHVARVVGELRTGLKVLEDLGIPLRTEKFPITVRLKTGRGRSGTRHGRGPVTLYHVERKAAPIIHELTHMLLGTTWRNGHWTPEGIASYLQDEHGEDRAFPTRKLPHAVMKVILENGAMLPMDQVMKDRRRKGPFGIRNLWDRWLAYTQSCSFTKYLVETHGLEKFMAIYDKRYEDQDFEGVYGSTDTALIESWLAHVRATTRGLDRARRIYRRFRAFVDRQ